MTIAIIAWLYLCGAVLMAFGVIEGGSFRSLNMLRACVVVLFWPVTVIAIVTLTISYAWRDNVQ